MSPVRRWSSEWQSPAATNLTSTSPSLGGSSSSSMISQSLPTSLSTAALVFMPPPASSACHIIRRPDRAVHVSGPKSPVPPLASGQHGNVGLRSGAELQLGAVVGGAAGQVGAVPGDDLADPPGGQRAEQVVAADEQLAGGRPRPGGGEQFGGQVGVEPGKGAPLVHDPGPGDQRV